MAEQYLPHPNQVALSSPPSLQDTLITEDTVDTTAGRVTTVTVMADIPGQLVLTLQVLFTYKYISVFFLNFVLTKHNPTSNEIAHELCVRQNKNLLTSSICSLHNCPKYG